MDEERFDFGNLKVYQKALAMDSKLRTPVRNGSCGRPFPTELRKGNSCLRAETPHSGVQA
jgi:hypothetical protein